MPTIDGHLSMGRTLGRIRMDVKATSDRWLRAGKALRSEDQRHASRLANYAQRQSTGAFAALDDPLEAELFSVLVEVLKELDTDQAE